MAAAPRRSKGHHVTRPEHVLDLRIDGQPVDLVRAGRTGPAAADALGGDPDPLGRPQYRVCVRARSMV